ncbi:MAG: helix-turn-helix domain-containing protein [Spirochaetota bacterium]|nr:helix-turn-helix domain-containing protein [Spirochaetota bacterium]
MGISVRNLQLKLKLEGTTYTQLLNEIRTDLAKVHLNDQQIAISEISYQLGFSEPSVFHKFLKNRLVTLLTITEKNKLWIFLVP